MRAIQTPELVAAVDLGSNSFHMIIARVQGGQLQVQDRLRDMVRLGAGLGKGGRLDEDAQHRALECLERFGQRLRLLPQGAVRAVGTKTLRTAVNAEAFLQRAEKALGHPIEIISGIEEARLIYQGVSHSLAFDRRRRLVMDIGGGSTEYIIGVGMDPLAKASLDMGCVSLSTRFFSDGRISAKAFKRAVLAAQQELEPVQAEFRRGRWEEAVGASGTLRAIHKLLATTGCSANGITQAGLNKLVEAVLNAGNVDKLQRLPDLNPKRAPVFPGGLAILCATFKALEVERMTVSDGALREGLVLDLLGRFRQEDVRARSVEALAARFHADAAHAGRLIGTARQLAEQLSFKPMLETDDALPWLEWACRLHEIGLDIAHHQYHKHGAYIVEHADLPGFSQQDQKLLAVLVQSHRRKLSPKLFKELAAPWDVIVPQLARLIRLAVLLHRSRHDIALPPLRLEQSGDAWSLVFPAGWLEQNPLTDADLAQEALYLSDAGLPFVYR